jgi:uncharacterized membrane protein
MALQKEYLIDLEDACVVVRDQGGQVHLKQAINLTRVGAATGGLRGAMWGSLIGLLFLNPLIGMAAGDIWHSGGIFSQDGCFDRPYAPSRGGRHTFANDPRDN